MSQVTPTPRSTNIFVAVSRHFPSAPMFPSPFKLAPAPPSTEVLPSHSSSQRNVPFPCHFPRKASRPLHHTHLKSKKYAWDAKVREVHEGSKMRCPPIPMTRHRRPEAVGCPVCPLSGLPRCVRPPRRWIPSPVVVIRQPAFPPHQWPKSVPSERDPPSSRIDPEEFRWSGLESSQHPAPLK
jgi:hypothetical protein